MNMPTGVIEAVLFTLGAIIFFLLFVWWIRRKPEKQVQAVVVHKEAHIPLASTQGPLIPIYKITFLSSGKKFHFTLSEKLFAKLPKGSKGILTYRGCEFIRFEGDGVLVEG